MSHYQGRYGDRRRSAWGTGEHLAEYAIGDVVWIPPDSPCVGARVDVHGLSRVHSCFSIGDDAAFYYRVSPMVPTGRGDRLRTRWEVCSDRIHVIPGRCDYTAGWVLLHSAVPP